jgi:hypothetical protein
MLRSYNGARLCDRTQSKIWWIDAQPSHPCAARLRDSKLSEGAIDVYNFLRIRDELRPRENRRLPKLQSLLDKLGVRAVQWFFKAAAVAPD